MDKPRNEECRKPFTAYRVIRIDGEYNPARHDEAEAAESAVTEIINGANTHSIVDGVRVTAVADCGESA